MKDGVAEFLQAERILWIDTPLGRDVLLAQRLVVREAISELFELRVSVRSRLPELAPAQLLGRPVDVSVELSQDPAVRRVWNAIVTDLVAGPRQSRDLRQYELVLRPKL